MKFELRAHNLLTGEIDTRRLRTMPDQREWEKVTDAMRESLQDIGIRDFEGYMELVDDRERQIRKVAMEW